MASIMADHNVEGHFEILLRLWTSEAWRSFWESLELEIESFDHLGLPHHTSDRDLWRVCQQRDIVLLTANRNDEGPESLEAAIRTLNDASSLPVLTIADCLSRFPVAFENAALQILLLMLLCARNGGENRPLLATF